jgi:hypothetical protein
MDRRTYSRCSWLKIAVASNAIQSQIVVVQAVAGKADGALVAGAGIDRAGNERSEGCPIPAVDRQFVDLPWFNRGAYRRVYSVQLRHGSYHVNLRSLSRQTQSGVERAGLPDLQPDVVKTDGSETLLGDIDKETSGVEIGQEIGALRSGFGVPCESGREIECPHLS